MSSSGRERVRTDDGSVREWVGAMFDLVVRHGGSVHPDLWVVEQDGSMSIHVDGRDGQRLMHVPAAILVPIGRVGIDVVADELVVAEPDDELTAVQRESLDVHLGLYNATKKMSWARTALPEVALAGQPAVVETLGRLHRRALRHDRSAATAFLATRTISFDAGRSSQAGTDDVRSDGQPEGIAGLGAERRPVLMPLLDLVNHHPQGAPFRGKADGLRARVAHPVGGTEAFVTYGADKDPIGTALRYGFVAADAHRTKVCPVEVELDGLRVVVEGRSHHVKHPLDPPAVSIDGSTLTLSHLTIDADHPQRVKVALSMAVQMATQSRCGAGGPITGDDVLAAIVRADRAVTDSVVGELARAGRAGETIERAIAVHRSVLDRAAHALDLEV